MTDESLAKASKLCDAFSTARAWATVFSQAVEDEINGVNPSWRRKAAKELYAALENLEAVEEE